MTATAATPLPTAAPAASAAAIFAANATDPGLAAPPPGGRDPQSWAEVQAWCRVHAPQLVQHIAKLEGKLDFGPLETLHLGSPDFAGFPTLLAWTEHHFPKVRKGALPKIAAGYGMTLDAYKTTRQKLLKALKDHTGQTAARAERNERADGWTELLARLKPLTENAGPLPKPQYGVVAKAADFARQAALEPWQLDTEAAAAAIREVLPTSEDRAVVNRAIRVLTEWRDLAALDDLLPSEPIPELPGRGAKDWLPDHVNAFVEKVVEDVAFERDPNTGKRRPRVSVNTIGVYRAALRHHLRLLPLCRPNADLGYTPVADLETINDVASLFAPEHVSATIRESEDRDHLPGTPTVASCRDYYLEIVHLVTTFESDTPPEAPPEARTFPLALVDELRRRVRKSAYLKRGRTGDRMTPGNEAWCRALVTDPLKERRFHNLHRLFQARAQEITQKGRDDHGTFHPDRLGTADLTHLVQFGTCAGVVALVVTGRPLRLGNVLGLRFRGQRQTIDRAKGWEFWIPGDEAKAGKDIPPAAPNPKTHGPQVLDWYVREIRPLLDPDNTSIYLFPAPRDAARPISKSTFVRWFKRAASTAQMSMNFHLFRHGWASILRKSGVPLEQIADMLGHTVSVCARNYAFLDEDHVVATTQAVMADRANALRKSARAGR